MVGWSACRPEPPMRHPLLPPIAASAHTPLTKWWVDERRPAVLVAGWSAHGEFAHPDNTARSALSTPPHDEDGGPHAARQECFVSVAARAHDHHLPSPAWGPPLPSMRSMGPRCSQRSGRALLAACRHTPASWAHASHIQLLWWVRGLDRSRLAHPPPAKRGPWWCTRCRSRPRPSHT
jgi:hypothetical protein